MVYTSQKHTKTYQSDYYSSDIIYTTELNIYKQVLQYLWMIFILKNPVEYH